MAKADDTTSTDWIFLREAWDIAVTAFGSMELAKDHLLWEWLAGGKLPWTCIVWEALDDAGIAKLRQTLWARGDAAALAAVTHYNGDPQFFGGPPEINWKDSTASMEGMVQTARGLSFSLCVAQARGIKVPRSRLLELLPGGPRKEPREDEKEAGPQQRRILPALKKIFPPDGKVPDDVPTETVRGLVNKELALENERLGLREASWDSINRALGREDRRR